MPLWWRAGRSTVAVRSARLPSMDGGRVGAVQSGAPLEALVVLPRSTGLGCRRAVGARTGVRTGGTRRPPAVRPMLMLHCPWACAPPLPIFYRLKTTGRRRVAWRRRAGPPAHPAAAGSPRAGVARSPAVGPRPSRAPPPRGPRRGKLITATDRTSPNDVATPRGGHAPQVTLDGRITARVRQRTNAQTAPLVCSMDLLPLSGAPRAIKLSSIRRPSRGKGAMVGACALLTSDVRARQLATTAAHRASQDKHGPVRFPML
jgi:hypothetical protein